MEFTGGPKWIKDRTILLTHTGSKAYGTNIEGISDTDIKGVCIPPKEYYLGLESFNEYNNTGGKNFKNTCKDVDINIIHISKFVKDAMAGVPNNLDILFTRREHIISINEFGSELVGIRHEFLSKQIYRKYGGYAITQKKRLEGVSRASLVREYEYDTKMAMHSVGLLYSAIEILTTGNLSTYHPKRELLMSIRRGNFKLSEVLDIISELDEKLKYSYKHTYNVPDKPNYGKINKWLIGINEKVILGLGNDFE